MVSEGAERGVRNIIKVIYPPPLMLSISVVAISVDFGYRHLGKHCDASVKWRSGNLFVISVGLTQ